MRVCNCCNKRLNGCGFYDEHNNDWYCTEMCVPIHVEVFWTTFDMEGME